MVRLFYLALVNIPSSLSVRFNLNATSFLKNPVSRWWWRWRGGRTAWRRSWPPRTATSGSSRILSSRRSVLHASISQCCGSMKFWYGREKWIEIFDQKRKEKNVQLYFFFNFCHFWSSNHGSRFWSGFTLNAGSGINESGSATLHFRMAYSGLMTLWKT